MGFMLEARECDDCPPAGSFSVLDFNSLLLCSGQVVAHSLSSDKSSVQVTWTPQATGQFFFRAAFVKNFIEFWTKKAIILSTTTTSPPTTTLMTTTPQTTTQKTMQTTTQTTTTTQTPTTLKTMMTTATTTSTATTTTVTTRRTTLGLTKLLLQHRDRRPKGSKYQKGADHRDRGNRGSRERQPDERECD
ncbi:reeler domain-containing protein isoform X1 [Danio rerio]